MGLIVKIKVDTNLLLKQSKYMKYFIEIVSIISCDKHGRPKSYNLPYSSPPDYTLPET